MLSDAKIKALKAREKRYKISDGENLYIQVMPSGGKTWIFEYRDEKLKKYRRISLGKYPDLSLANARLKKTELRRDLAEGKSLDDKLNIKSFELIFAEWIKLKKLQVSEKSIKRFEASYKNVLLNKIGNKNIKDISKSDIIDCLMPSLLKEQFEAANKLIHLLNMIFNYSVAKEYIDTNIMQKLDKKALFTQESKHYPAFYEQNKIKALISSINEYTGIDILPIDKSRGF